MISLIRGTLIEATPQYAIVDAAGVGFELGISSMTAAALPALGAECRLYARLQVREDAMTLFGFASKEERAMFDHLLSVSGVGPRLALAILSRYSVSQVYSIVMAEDATAMSAVSGVGKKTAQRLILELKSTFAKDRSFAAAEVPAANQTVMAFSQEPSVLEDARQALLSMGFSPQETELALDGYDGQGMRVEDLLGAALRRLGMDA
mgnify:FL=1